MSPETDYAELRGHLIDLQRHAGWKAIVEETHQRIGELGTTALSLATKPKETQQIKRAIQELHNHGPEAVLKSLLATANHKTGIKP